MFHHRTDVIPVNPQRVLSFPLVWFSVEDNLRARKAHGSATIVGFSVYSLVY